MTAERRRALAIVGLLCGVALLFFAGRMETSDEQLMALTTRSIATHASLHFPETYGQTSTGYGLGTPLVGIPAFALESLASRLGLPATVTLMPLTNILLFGLLGAASARLARRLSPAGACTACVEWRAALLVMASPLLPAANSFTSEPLAALSIVALAGALVPGARCRLDPAVAFVAACLAIMARPAMVPLVGLALAWSFLEDRRAIARLAAGAAGAAAGVAVRLIQNAILRGSPFAQGYDGQEFTTPIVTGLFGLLVAPERGILPYAPVALLVVSASGLTGRYRRFAIAALAFWTVMHASFWAWHGGWTVGPRFLLPVIALALPAVAAAWPTWSIRLRQGGSIAIAWSAAMAILHSSLSPQVWWNTLWRFHETEARWQFEPQLSLLANWGAAAMNPEGVKPIILRVIGFPSEQAVWVAVLLAGAAVAVWRGRSALRFAVAVLLIALAAARLGSPIGWSTDGVGEKQKIAYARFAEPTSATALIDLRPQGTYTLHLRAAGSYRVELDGRVLLEQRDPVPRHISSLSIEAPASGPRLLEVDYRPPPASDEVAALELFWTWPGEGRLLQPIGGDYVLTSEPTGIGKACLAFWRARWLILGAALALVLLIPTVDRPGRAPEVE